MSEPHRTRGRRARHDELLIQQLLFQAAWRFAWKALARYRLTDADRSDVAQEAVISAWRARTRYRSERGNAEQWLSRIVRNTAIDFLNERRRGGSVVDVEALADVPSTDWPLEERMSLRDLADLVFAVLPDDERRAVIAVAIEGLTLREAAAAEGISPSTVHERYERGIAALRAAVEQRDPPKPLGVAVPITAIVALPADEPPPELLERAWQQAIVELGLDRAPDSEAPPSEDPRGDSTYADDAPAPRGPPGASAARLAPLLGSLGGMLVGGVLTAIALRGPAPDRRHDEPGKPAPALAASAGLQPESAGVAAPSPAAIVDTATGQKPAANGAATPPGDEKPAANAAATPPGDEKPSATDAATPRPAPSYRDPRDPERALIDRGRAALVAGDVAVALALLAEHAQRFPRGENASLRALLWDEACAHARRAQPRGDARCR